jgi:hypothetical protein
MVIQSLVLLWMTSASALVLGDALPADKAAMVTEFLEIVDGEQPEWMRVVQILEQETGHGEALDVSLGAKASVGLDKAEGTIFSYLAADFDPPAAEALPVELRLSPQQVFSKAVPLLQYYSLPMNISEYSIAFSDHVGCVWEVKKELSIDGIPARGRGIQILFSADSGRILSVFYRPLVAPPPTASPIPKAEAVTIVDSWLRTFPTSSRSRGIVTANEEEVRHVVATGYRHLLEGAQFLKQAAAQQASHCWEVPFTVEEQGHTFTLMAWVRMEDGVVFDSY